MSKKVSPLNRGLYLQENVLWSIQAARSSKGNQSHHTCCLSQLVCGDAPVQNRRAEVAKSGLRRCLLQQNPQL